MKKSFVFLFFAILAGCGENERPIFQTTSCNIDAPTPNSAISAKSPFSIRGWMFDKPSASDDSKMRIQFASEDRKSFKTFQGSSEKRPDVAAYFSDKTAEATGFSAQIPSNSLPTGKYIISVIKESDKSQVLCSAFSIVITE